MTPQLLLIDNYDSFTYNLVQAFMVLGAHVEVRRNDAIDVTTAQTMNLSHLVVSPGPGRPEDAGVSMELIRAFGDRCPVLGVCLGHQCIVQVFGGEIVPAPRLMHGKTSLVHHEQDVLFEDIPNPFEAGRYHSLTAEDESLPEELMVTASTEAGEIMAIRHRQLELYGVQFHPESVLTPDGDTLLSNFLKIGHNNE